MKNKVPKLRFPEFSGEWEEYKISDSEIKVIDGDRGSHYPNANEFSLKGYCLFLNAKNVTKSGFSFKENNFISKERDCLLRKGKLQKNDLVLTTRGTIGNIANFNNKINIEHMRINSGMVILRNENPKLYSDYIYYYFLSSKMEKIITKISFGSAQPQLTVKEINNFKITFSSLPEQEKIANFLSSVNIKIEKLEKKKELLEKYKKGMMQKLFSQKLRFKDENGNDYPEWEEKQLGDIGDIITGNTPETSKMEYYGGEYLFISPIDINSNRYVKTTKTTLTKAGFFRGRKIPKMSICFVCIGSTIGKIAQNFQDCITNQQINSIVPFENINADFIYSLLEYKSNKIKLLAAEQAVPLINKTDFSKIKINIPSLPEQEKIADFLSIIDEKIEVLEKKLEELKEFKKGLLQQMFV